MVDAQTVKVVLQEALIHCIRGSCYKACADNNQLNNSNSIQMINWSAHWQVLQKPSHDPDHLNQVPWRRETSKPCRPVALEERIWTFGLRCTVCTMWLPVNPGRFAPKSSGIGSSSAVTQSRQVQQIMDAWIHITRGTKKKIFRYLSQDGFIAFMSRYK